MENQIDLYKFSGITEPGKLTFHKQITKVIANIAKIFACGGLFANQPV